MFAALVEQAKRGDREAYDSLARMTGDRCMAIAFRILRDFDLADDAVQSALLTAWRELRTLRDPERFEPWLHRILTNACYAEAKGRRRWSEGVRLVRVEAEYGPDEYALIENRDQLERAFRRLTVQQRAVLVFHHYLGLTLPEVAVRMGLPLGRSSPECITPSKHSGPVSMQRIGRPEHPRSDRHDRAARPRPAARRLPSGRAWPAARRIVRRRPRSH